MNINVHSLSERSIIHTPVATGGVTLRTNPSSGSSKTNVSKENNVAIKPSQAASIQISETGKQLARMHATQKIHTTEEAKANLVQIATDIKANIDSSKKIHSNLRVMRINNLIYD